jgi:hypothetical protein
LIDIDAARRYLAQTLDGEIEIKDEEVLNDAAAVFAVSHQNRAPGSSRPGLAITRRSTTRGSDYPDSATIAG